MKKPVGLTVWWVFGTFFRSGFITMFVHGLLTYDQSAPTYVIVGAVLLSIYFTFAIIWDTIMVRRIWRKYRSQA